MVGGRPRRGAGQTEENMRAVERPAVPGKREEAANPRCLSHPAKEEGIRVSITGRRTEARLHPHLITV